MLQTGKYGKQNDGCLAGLVAKSCWTRDVMGCSQSGSSVRGILQEEHWSGLPYMVYKSE